MRRGTTYLRIEFMSDENQTEKISENALIEHLSALKTAHRRLDNEINAVMESGVTDMLKLRRMKKIKLSMKDKIVFIQNQLTPDILA